MTNTYKSGAVSSYRTVKVNFEWTLKNWRWSPEYIRNEGNNVQTMITSPVIESEDGLGLRWQLRMILCAKDRDEKRNLYFQCFCIEKPAFNPEDILRVQGTLRTLNDEGNEITYYTLDQNSYYLTNSPVFHTISHETSKFSDNMSLSADFTIVGWKGTTMTSSEKVTKPTSSVDTFLSQLAADEEFSDLMIEVEDQEISAHKVVLAARSPVLRAMLSTDMKEKKEARIVLSDVSAAAWRLFQNFLYTDCFEPPEDCEVAMLLDVLMLSDKYEVLPLRTRVEDVLLTRLTKENVLEIVEAAEKFDMPGIKEAAFDVIRNNWEILKKEKKLVTLLASCPDFAAALLEKIKF